MATYVYRNQGGIPKFILTRGMQTIDGYSIPDVASLTIQEKRQYNIFEVVQNIPTRVHQYQTETFSHWDWDVSTMVATENFILADWDKAVAIDNAYVTVANEVALSLKDGVKWTGAVVDGAGNPVVYPDACVLCRDQDKTDLLIIKEQFASGVFKQYLWRVGPNRYAPLTSSESVQVLFNTGLMYIIELQEKQSEFGNKLEAIELDPAKTTAHVATELDNYMAWYQANPIRRRA